MSNSGPAFDYIVKAGQPARQKVFPGDTFDITDFDPETQKEIQKKLGDAGAEPGQQ